MTQVAIVRSKYENAQNKLQKKQFHLYLTLDNHLNNILKVDKNLRSE